MLLKSQSCAVCKHLNARPYKYPNHSDIPKLHFDARCYEIGFVNTSLFLVYLMYLVLTYLFSCLEIHEHL